MLVCLSLIAISPETLANSQVEVKKQIIKLENEELLQEEKIKQEKYMIAVFQETVI